jgi:hypothetical protein
MAERLISLKPCCRVIRACFPHHHPLALPRNTATCLSAWAMCQRPTGFQPQLGNPIFRVALTTQASVAQREHAYAYSLECLIKPGGGCDLPCDYLPIAWHDWEAELEKTISRSLLNQRTSVFVQSLGPEYWYTTSGWILHFLRQSRKLSP